MKTQVTGPHPQSFRSGSILRIFASNKLPDDTGVVGPGTTPLRTTGIKQALQRK